MKKGLTAEQIAAAAASGAKLEDLELAGGGTTPPVAEGAPQEPAPAEPAAPAAEGAPQEPAPAGPAAPAASEEGTTVSAYLETQLAKANDKITDLTVENKELKTKAAAVDEQLPKLKTIASEAINRMNVAMGMSRVDLSGSTAEALIKQYEATSEQFNKTFKIGGLTSGKAPEEKKPATITNIEEARMASVGIK